MKYLIFVFAFALVSTSTMAEPTVRKFIEYYDVRGWDAAFIHNEMDAKGPRDRNSGNRVWAHTDWYVTWKFKYAEEPLSCKINHVETDVKINFVVPRWVERDKAPQSVKDKWDAFYAILQKHEQKHAMHGVSAAREIETSILTLPAKRTCKQAKEAAHALAKSITDKYAAMDIAYDNKTDNGRTEGIVF
jgi:predicted secreted Zn-dependent protease